MPDSRLLWRALAWLGALLLIGSMWPIICAARPFPSYRDFSVRRQIGTETITVNYSTTQRPSDLNSFLNVLTNRNDTNARIRTDNQMTINQSLAFPNARIGHPMVVRPRKTYDSNRITADTIKSIFRGKQPRMQANFNYQNRRNLTKSRIEIIATQASPPIQLETTTIANPLASSKATETNQEMITAASIKDQFLSSETIDKEAKYKNDILASVIRAQHKINDIINANKLNTITTSTPSQNVDSSTTATQPTAKAPSTRTTTIQSVFLDYRNFNEALTLPIDNLFNSTTKNSQTLPRSDLDLPSTTTTSTTVEATKATESTEVAAVTARENGQINATNANKRKKRLKTNSNLERNERSANLSLAKTSKRIQILMKGRLLQILPDGTVNGTQNDESDHTIMQRATVDVGQIRLQGVATCLYLCMDACGNLYGAKEFTNDCVFDERMQDNYNYYTSTHHSSSLKTFYVALNRLGAPRKTHIPTNKTLGKLATYVRSITLTVPEHKSDALVARLFGANHIKHGLKHLCTSARGLQELTAKKMYVPQCGGNGGGRTRPQQMAPAMRPKRPHTGPISLSERNHRRPVSSTTAKCTHEPCPKRKKKIVKNGVATSLAPDARSLIGRTESPPKAKETPIRHRKKVKHKPHKLRKQSPTPQTTTEATTTTTTVAAVSVDENLISDDDDDDDDVPSTGATAVSSDADDDYGYDS